MELKNSCNLVAPSDTCSYAPASFCQPDSLAPSHPRIYKAQGILIIIKKEQHMKEQLTRQVKFNPGYMNYSHMSADNRIEIAFTLRENFDTSMNMPGDHARLLLGDDCEWRNNENPRCTANAVFVEYDLRIPRIALFSSIIGLPPLFIHRTAEMTIIASDIHLMSMIPGVNLRFNQESINELCSIGHPINNKTLFADVEMISAGHVTRITPQGQISILQSWFFPEQNPMKDWLLYIDQQMTIFKQAMQAMDISNSFLSLTAGLDTRAILAALVQNDQTLPAYTISGKIQSIDARIACNLCKAYNMHHEIIELGKEFYTMLPTYITEASRLSGGLASLEQAHEIFFYRQIHRHRAARLSGNLANQLCHGGAEKISMRLADSSILNRDVFFPESGKNNAHWYSNVPSTRGSLDYRFSLQNEFPFASLANFCIGNSYAVQQSPYANRALIENTLRMPREKITRKSVSVIRMRLKDLHYRFMGPSDRRSFQVKLIKDVGRQIASYPINWGWTVNGGVSGVGLVRGGLALMDASLNSVQPKAGFMFRALNTMKIAGLHNYRFLGMEMKSLQEFMYDTLLNNNNCVLFDKERLRKIIDEHYGLKTCHHKTLIFALDLAVAKQIFHAAA